MKKFWIIWLFVMVVTCLLMYQELLAQTIPQCSVERPCTMWWNENTESDLAGYRVYVRQVSGPYDVIPNLDIEAPKSIVSQSEFQNSLGNLAEGQYVASVSAYDKSGNESKKSNEVRFDFVDKTPPGVPTLNIIEVSRP